MAKSLTSKKSTVKLKKGESNDINYDVTKTVKVVKKVVKVTKKTKTSDDIDNKKSLKVKDDDAPQKNKPQWFDENLSESINLPSSLSDKYKNYNLSMIHTGFGNSYHDKKYNHHYVFKKKYENKYVIDDDLKPSCDFDKLEIEMREKLKNNINNIQKNVKYDKKKKDIAIKTCTTRINKKIKELQKVTICKKIRIYPSDEQKKILDKWFADCSKVYNECVSSYYKDKEMFKDPYTKIKLKIFKQLGFNSKKSKANDANDVNDDNDNDDNDNDGDGDDKQTYHIKKTPYDTLTDEVRIFCSNLKSNYTQVHLKQKYEFTMKPKNATYRQCLFLPKTAMKQNGFFLTHLGPMDGFTEIKKYDQNNDDDNNNDHIFDHDCRLLCDKIRGIYTVLVPMSINRKVIMNRQKIVALDPGEKIFMSYFGLNEFGHFGYNIRDKILHILSKISKWQKLLSKSKKKRKNKKGNILKNIKNIKLKINDAYEKIKNIRNELHNKTALHLCKNYDMIIIPEFSTQQMLKTDKNYGIGKRRVTEAYKKGIEDGRKAKKEYTKRKGLNKKVKFVLNMLSHYRFRQHLINKADEHGCNVKVITEEYTSKACTKCGEMSEEYDNVRKKTCKGCKYEIDRDINGSRNILIKNMKDCIKNMNNEMKKK